MKRKYYSMLNKITQQMKADGKYIIERDDLKQYINFDGEDPEDIADFLKNFMVSVVTYQNNYRSVVKGKCIYIDTDALKSKIIAESLVNNAQIEVKTKAAVLRKLETIMNGLPDEPGQISFSPDEDGKGYTLIEEMSKQELVDLIIQLQEAAENNQRKEAT